MGGQMAANQANRQAQSQSQARQAPEQVQNYPDPVHDMDFGRQVALFSEFMSFIFFFRKTQSSRKISTWEMIFRNESKTLTLPKVLKMP